MPKTAHEREAAFRQDLADLLAKHDAELEVTDDGKGYGMHNGICVITMMPKYQGDELVADYTEFRL
jgi:hypothetical protein